MDEEALKLSLLTLQEEARAELAIFVAEVSETEHYLERGKLAQAIPGPNPLRSRPC